MLNWIDNLVSFWAEFSNTAALWEYNSRSWVWPLNALRGFFVALSNVVDDIFGAMLDFSFWVDGVVEDIEAILNWQEIIDWIRDRLDDLGDVVAWFLDWWNNVGDYVREWWYGVSDLVKDWIDTATQGLGAMVAAWSNFVSVILPTLFDLEFAEEWYKDKLLDIGDLIASSFTERSDLWRGWSDFRQAVSDLVTAPFDWLEARFIDWFLGSE